MRAATLLATACAITLVSPGVLADAGRPEDAPNEWENAWDVPAGTWNGTLGGEDRADWYRHDATSNETVVFHVNVSAPGYRFEVREDNGTLRRHHDLPCCKTSIVGMTGGRALRFGILDIASENTTTNRTAPPAWYSIRLHTFTEVSPPPPPPVDVAELGIRTLWVENVPDLPTPITTDQGPLSSGTKRIVHVEVVNEGNLTAAGLVGVAASGKTAGRSFIGSRSFELAPGDVASVSFAWNAVGSVGDVQVDATLFPFQQDADPSNNAKSVRHYVVAGGLGAGVVLESSTCLVGACVHLAEGEATVGHWSPLGSVSGNVTLFPRPSAGACAGGAANACAWGSVP